VIVPEPWSRWEEKRPTRSAHVIVLKYDIMTDEVTYSWTWPHRTYAARRVVAPLKIFLKRFKIREGQD
jgi:hypothetical protein